MNPFPDRRPSRKPDMDYSQPGYYFITISSYMRQNLFGKIANGVMQTNSFGQAVQNCWQQLPNYYSRLELDAFVVMPNHVHGILILKDFVQTSGSFKISDKQNISEIVRAFKSFSAREINKTRQTPGKPVWQRSFYDRVIRSNKELGLTRLYIVSNPVCWSFDHENIENTLNRDEIKKNFISTGIFNDEDSEIISNYIEFRRIKRFGAGGS